MARAFAETAYGIAPRAALLARRFHDAARTQQVLNAHRRVARAVVRPGSAVGAVAITVLPRQSATEPRPMQSEDVVALVAERGFTGTVEACELVREEETLPVVRHERYVLIDLLRAMFDEADANADGMITMPELAGFLSRHGLEGATGCISVLVENGPEHKLDFGEFKALLLRTRLVGLQDNSASGTLSEYGVHRSLMHVAAASIFDVADRNSDGRVSRGELEVLFASMGLGDAERAAASFTEHDVDGDGSIDKGGL